MVATPAKTRAIYHRVSDEIRTKAVQEHRADIIQEGVGNDPMPDVTISQLPILVKDQVPIISTQSTFPVPATKQMVQDLLKPKNVCGPFSAAAKIVVQKYQYPVNILEQTFFGSGCFRTDEIVDFFLGIMLLNIQMTSRKLSITQFALSKISLLRLDKAWRNYLLRLCKVLSGRESKFKLSLSLIYKHKPFLNALVSSVHNGLLTVFGIRSRNIVTLTPLLGVPSPLCNCEADVGLTCPVYSQQSIAPQLLRAVAIVDNNLNFRVVQSELADRDNHAPCWRVLI